jgi:hypothetical protein
MAVDPALAKVEDGVMDRAPAKDVVRAVVKGVVKGVVRAGAVVKAGVMA